MAYSEPDLPVTGTSISSANFGIKVRNNQVDHQARLLVLEANAMQLIAEHEVASDAEYLIEFDSIPATYRHLKIIGQCRFVNGSGSSPFVAAYLRINDDSGNNYERVYLQTDMDDTSPATTHPVPSAVSLTTIARAPTDDATSPYNANYAFNVEATIANYAGTSFYKNIQAIFHSWYGVSDTLGAFLSYAAVWKSTSAITKLSIAPSFTAGVTTFKTGSVFSLYGMK